MGTATAKDKNAYTAKAYDRLNIFVKKGLRDVIRGRANECGKNSINSYVVGLILADLEKAGK